MGWLNGRCMDGDRDAGPLEGDSGGDDRTGGYDGEVVAGLRW